MSKTYAEQVVDDRGVVVRKMIAAQAAINDALEAAERLFPSREKGVGAIARAADLVRQAYNDSKELGR